MKKLISTALLFTMISSAFAQESQIRNYSCIELYQQQAQIAKHKRDSYNYKFNRIRGDLSINGALGVVGLMGGLVTGSLPIVLVATLTPTIISELKNIPSKEERALRLQKESAKQLSRFVKRLKKKVSPEISSQEVIEVIQAGLDNGDFCKDASNLDGPSKIRKYVKSKLKAKYAKAELQQLLNDASQSHTNVCGEGDDIVEDEKDESDDEL